MTAATAHDLPRPALEQVLYDALGRICDQIDDGQVSPNHRIRHAKRLADARIVAEFAGLDLTLPHFAPLVDVIEQAIALPDRKDGAA